MTVSFTGMTLTLHKSRIHCSGIMQWWPMSLQFTKSATLPVEAGCETWGRIVLHSPLSRNNNMATNVHVSHGNRRFAACDCWTLTSAAGNAARQRLLIAVSRCEKKHLYDMKTEKKYCCQRVLYGVKRNIAANEAHFWDCCRNVGHFLCGVARVKGYVNVYLHLYRQQPEMDNQSVDFAYPWKNFCGRPCLCYLCLQSNICFVLRYK